MFYSPRVVKENTSSDTVKILMFRSLSVVLHGLTFQLFSTWSEDKLIWHLSRQAVCSPSGRSRRFIFQRKTHLFSTVWSAEIRAINLFLIPDNDPSEAICKHSDQTGSNVTSILHFSAQNPQHSDPTWDNKCSKSYEAFKVFTWCTILVYCPEKWSNFNPSWYLQALLCII